jgi:hypothetical protein
MTTRVDPPESGGVIIKRGANTNTPKVREFCFQVDKKSDCIHIKYRTRKFFAKESESHVVLTTFFVRKVRAATEEELTLVTRNGYCVGKRCFDVDFYDPNFPLAVGPQKLRTLTIFPLPETSLGDLWTFFAQEMFAENIFQPDSLDPEKAVVVGVGGHGSPSIKTIDENLTSPAIVKRAGDSLDAMINRLPLPPPDTEVVDLDESRDTDSVIAGN